MSYFTNLMRDNLDLTDIDIQFIENKIKEKSATITTVVNTVPGYVGHNLLTLAISSILNASELGLNTYFSAKMSTRNLYSAARLTYNGSLEYKFEDRAKTNGYDISDPEEVFKYVHTLLTGGIARTTNCNIGIHFIEVPSGFRNLSKLMAYNKIPELNIQVQQNKEHTVRVYKYEQHLYVISNSNISSYQKFFKKLTGAIPLIYNELFKNLNTEIPWLYTYFENCFNDSTTVQDCISYIANTDFIKNITQQSKIVAITDFFNNLETSMSETAILKIRNQKSLINDLETDLLKHYTILKTLERNASIPEIIDKDLIMPFLINNKDVKSIKVLNNIIYVSITGRVDYDKQEIKKVLKNQTNFINWVLTLPTIHLHWQACCSLDMNNNSINNYEDGYNNNYLPNTHWRSYACFGDNKTIIQKALVQRDLLTVFSKTITAAYQLNIYDITVLNRMIDKLKNSYWNTKTFYNEDDNQWLSMCELSEIYRKITTKPTV